MECLRYVKSKGVEEDYHATINQKKAKVTILIFEKADFKTRRISRNKEVLYTVIKRSILQEDITVLNVHVTNKRVPSYVRQDWQNCEKRWKSPLSLLETVIPLSVIGR